MFLLLCGFTSFSPYSIRLNILRPRERQPGDATPVLPSNTTEEDEWKDFPAWVKGCLGMFG